MEIKFGISLPNFEDFGDARILATLAHQAEEAGVTWWIEDISPYAYGVPWDAPIWPTEVTAKLETRLLQGPPPKITTSSKS